jgi:hypothetical protein
LRPEGYFDLALAVSVPFAGGEILTTSQVIPAARPITQGMKAATPSSPKNVCTTLVE